jgi:DNA repair exonuclease SbcCD nuclease subunit
MIKKIIAVSDIHIRNLRRSEEYKEKLSAFIEECKDFVSEYNRDEVRIVIAGDIFHNKTDISPEAYVMCAWLLKQLDRIAKTIVISGNHDMSQNEARLDALSTVFSMCKFKNTYYLDKELDYESGCLKDDNVVWCLYSSFDGFAKPSIDEYRIENPDCTFVGLFHGDVKGSRTDAGYQSENGLNASYFDGLDFGILGHIHKKQCIEHDGIRLVYCGSLIQQDFGENLSKHGFVIWDVESRTYEDVDFKDEEYGFYNFSINSIEDLDNDTEEIINL